VADVAVNPEFWAGRRVFLTGDTGFIGGWLSLWLQSMKAEVFGFALAPPTEPNIFKRADVASGMLHTHGDVRELQPLTAALRAADPDIVFHLAAQPLVRESYQDPVGTYATNVMGTVHLLEAARQARSKPLAVIVVTSDKCYENTGQHHGYRESDPMGGHDPYSSSKGCSELVTWAYRRSFFATSGADLAIASVRAGNVLGGGDWGKDRLIPDAVKAFAKGQPLTIRNPSAVRPWQHVLDVLAGYLRLAELLCEKKRSDHCDAWNFGPDAASVVTVADLVDRLVKHWGGNASWVKDAGPHFHEMAYLSLDATKARNELGWRPRLVLDDALGWTVAWFKEERRSSGSMRDFTLGQIHKYLHS
jgi:CDP-glucose 4,6-dehydratase